MSCVLCWLDTGFRLLRLHVPQQQGADEAVLNAFQLQAKGFLLLGNAHGPYFITRKVRCVREDAVGLHVCRDRCVVKSDDPGARV